MRNTKINKLFFSTGLFALLFLLSAEAMGQFFPAPRRDPNFDGSVNPKTNTYINPDLTPNLHPKFNAGLNPVFTPILHPNSNPNINPSIQPDLNPDFNSDINYRYNPGLDPNSGGRPAFFLYDTDAQVQGCFMEAIPGRVYIYFDAALQYGGFYVTNGAGGYNAFGPDIMYLEMYLVPNSQGNFNLFNRETEWLGFTAP